MHRRIAVLLLFSLAAPAVQAQHFTNQQLADMAASTVKCRPSGSGTGAPQDCNASQITAIIGSGAAANATDGTLAANELAIGLDPNTLYVSSGLVWDPISNQLSITGHHTSTAGILSLHSNLASAGASLYLDGQDPNGASTPWTVTASYTKDYALRRGSGGGAGDLSDDRWRLDPNGVAKLRKTGTPADPGTGWTSLYAQGSNLYYFPAGGSPTQLGTNVGLTLLEQHSASSSSSLDFTTCFTSAYDDYQIEIVAFKAATNGAAPLLRFSTDGGSSYDPNSVYDWQNTVYPITGGGGTNGQTSVDGVSLFSDSSRVGLLSSALPGMALSFHIYNPLSTSDYKFVGGHDGLAQYSSNSVRYYYTFGGVYRNVSAVNAFRIIMSSGNITSGTVRCYGYAK